MVCYAAMSMTDDTSWLDELLAMRRKLQRRIFAADASSATVSSGGGSKSYSQRSVAEMKEKLAALEAEIAAECAKLGKELPFAPSGGMPAFISRGFA